MKRTLECGRGRFRALPGIWRLTLDTDVVAPDAAWALHHAGPHSYLYRLEGQPPILAKLIVPRSQPRDALRKYARCQARREYDSAVRLRAAGLRAPSVHGWGLSLSPFAAFESVLFMERIEPFHSALTFIRKEVDRERRHRFFLILAREVAQLHGHGLIHKDGHFDNLGLYDERTLVWIDNDIRRASSARALRAGFVKMLALLRHTARGDVSAEEWRLFEDRLAGELSRWPQAGMLANEI